MILRNSETKQFGDFYEKYKDAWRNRKYLPVG